MDEKTEDKPSERAGGLLQQRRATNLLLRELRRTTPEPLEARRALPENEPEPDLAAASSSS